MSTQTPSTTKTDEYAALKDQAKHSFVEALKEFGKGFWAFAEETGETSTKSFDGWL